MVPSDRAPWKGCAVLDETDLIERAWRAFAPETLSRFEALMAQDYHFDFPPLEGEAVQADWQKMSN